MPLCHFNLWDPKDYSSKGSTEHEGQRSVCPEGPRFFHFLSFWCQRTEKLVYFDCRGFWACLETKNTEFSLPFDLLSTCGLQISYTKHTQTKGNRHVSLFVSSGKKVDECNLFLF